MEKKREKMVLVDTDIFVDFLRDFLPAKELFKALQLEGIHYSAITETELLAGKKNDEGEARNQLLMFLSQGIKISVDNPIAQRAGDLCRQQGLTVPDALIAATALVNRQELISRNQKDFGKIPELKLRMPY